ncbi:MAG: response regulator [Bdellovibrionales bacterium]|nr:response regulator [Bdellovibrionales bacterium]
MPFSSKVPQSVLDHLLEGCQVIGFDFRYLYVNPAVAAQGQSTVEALLGRTMVECYPGIDDTPMFALLKKCMLERLPQQMENEFRHPNGSRGFFELRMVPVPEGVCILSQDVTHRKSLESQVYQLQKMEAVSRLAGGMAHDFNNVLSVIGIHAEELSKMIQGREGEAALLAEIQSAVEKSTQLTRQLLTFSRSKVLELNVIDVNQVISNFLKMLESLVGAQIKIVLKLGTKLDPVKIDTVHLEQVIMNLAVNARDAMPSGGTLTIETSNAELDQNYVSQHLDSAPGSYVRISVSDTGTGMSSEVQSRIFDPFFTTKEPGKGTGLGLSTVYGIVKQHHGSIWVYSEPGRGTKFTFFLPRASKVRQAETATSIPSMKSSLNGSETLLLVDDNEALRNIMSQLLKQAGYDVHTAENGEDALRLLSELKKPIHMVITDVVMPGISGPELAKILRDRSPQTRFLFLSGHIAQTFEDVPEMKMKNAFLEKPFSAEILKRRIREILG